MSKTPPISGQALACPKGTLSRTGSILFCVMRQRNFIQDAIELSPDQISLRMIYVTKGAFVFFSCESRSKLGFGVTEFEITPAAACSEAPRVLDAHFSSSERSRKEAP